jgi:hypothetical protein
VAAGKIINLHIPELYSIVRGKVGRKVEFGLSWGITRLRGGFVPATLAGDPDHSPDFPTNRSYASLTTARQEILGDGLRIQLAAVWMLLGRGGLIREWSGLVGR